MSYQPQVHAGHYREGSYRSADRWASYFHQLELVRRAHPKSVLEIGPGEGIVTESLRKDDMAVTTCDIAADVHPDVVGSITKLPFPDKSFDTALAAEVLEHIAYDDVQVALAELRRVAQRYVVIGLPHAGYTFSIMWKVPLFRRSEFLFKIPFFWKEHRFNGEHYWELGKKGYSAKRFIATAKAQGLTLESALKFADDPAHRFFVFTI
jgi:ubiquinone/menaquinone biosynthesis C-methylase UbiE